MLPDLVNPGSPVEAVWGNEVVAALEALLAQLNASTPIGTCLPYGGDSPPNAFWMLAQGQSISRTTYSSAYAVLGDKFGVGRPAPPAGDFWLPDMRGLIPVGALPGGAYAATVGTKFGSKDAALISHAHSVNLNSGGESDDHAHYANLNSDTTGDHVHLPGGPTGQFITATINPSGVIGSGGAQLAQCVFVDSTALAGAHAHNSQGWTGGRSAAHYHNTSGSTLNAGGPTSGSNLNLPPSVAMNYIIRVI